METKPKSRKVAWVVLGVVVLGATLAVIPVWGDLWMTVAYRPITLRTPVVHEDTPRNRLNTAIFLLQKDGMVEGARDVEVVTLRASWLPGPMLIFTFLDERGEQIERREYRQ